MHVCVIHLQNVLESLTGLQGFMIPGQIQLFSLKRANTPLLYKAIVAMGYTGTKLQLYM